MLWEFYSYYSVILNDAASKDLTEGNFVVHYVESVIVKVVPTLIRQCYPPVKMIKEVPLILDGKYRSLGPEKLVEVIDPARDILRVNYNFRVSQLGAKIVEIHLVFDGAAFESFIHEDVTIVGWLPFEGL